MEQIEKRYKDINWLYNIEERRYRTYKEMIERREIEQDYRSTHFTKLLSPEQHILYSAKLKQIRDGEDEEEEEDMVALSDEDILRLSLSGSITGGQKLEDLPDFYEQDDLFDLENDDED